jgi:hypothetical protein
LLNALAWRLIPRRWRLALPIIVALWQGYIITKNYVIQGDAVGGMCGVG